MHQLFVRGRGLRMPGIQKLPRMRVAAQYFVTCLRVDEHVNQSDAHWPRPPPQVLCCGSQAWMSCRNIPCTVHGPRHGRAQRDHRPSYHRHRTDANRVVVGPVHSCWSDCRRPSLHGRRADALHCDWLVALLLHALRLPPPTCVLGSRGPPPLGTGHTHPSRPFR